jgi:copper chaperone CopZ
MNTTAPSILNIGIDGMSCGRCVAQVTKALNGVPGVEVKGVTVGSVRVAVPDDATANAALAAIQGAGYAARISPSESATAKGGGCCGGGGASGSEKGKTGGGSCCG